MDHDYQPAGYCPRCNYATDVGVCPECGHEIPATKLLNRPSTFLSRNWKKLTAALLAASLYGTIHFEFIVPTHHIPTAVLLFLQERADSPFAGDELHRRFISRLLSPAETDQLVQAAFSDKLHVFPSGHFCATLAHTRSSSCIGFHFYTFKTIEFVDIDGTRCPLSLLGPLWEDKQPMLLPEPLKGPVAKPYENEQVVVESFVASPQCPCTYFGSEANPPPHPHLAVAPFDPPTYHIVGLTPGRHEIKISVRTRLFSAGDTKVLLKSWTTLHTGTCEFDPVDPGLCNHCNLFPRAIPASTNNGTTAALDARESQIQHHSAPKAR